MCYDINKIRRTTEKGIPDLADAIFAGFVDENQAMNALYKGLRPKMIKELEKRKTDEILWTEAANSCDLAKLKDYVETYDNEAPEYRGRHLDEAANLIELIENDDKEWLLAKTNATLESFKRYLDIYNIPDSPYQGKHVDQVLHEIKVVKDKEDWSKAIQENSIKSFTTYLSLYDRCTPDYVGLFVEEAKTRILSLEEETAWLHACNLNTVQAYEDYISKYDVLPPAFRGHHIEEARDRIASLMPPPPPDPRLTDDEAWDNACRKNTIPGYEEYLDAYDKPNQSYKGAHVSAAKSAILKLQDDADWESSLSVNTLEAYRVYLSKYDNDKSGHVGLHINEAKRAIENLTLPDPRLEDDKVWREASKKDSIDEYRNYLRDYTLHANEAEIAIRRLIDDASWQEADSLKTIASYEKYLSICMVNDYPRYSWAHIKQAEEAILRLQEDEDWGHATSQNTLDSYCLFVKKYDAMAHKYTSKHLSVAKKKVREMTPYPHNPFKKILAVVLFLTGILLATQYFRHAWPFGPTTGTAGDVGNTTQDGPGSNGNDTVISQVDSLQWAIDNHNIPMLTRYAELDSTRAFYPLASELYRVVGENDLDYDSFGKWVVKSFNTPDSLSGRKLWDKYAKKIVEDLANSIDEAYSKIDWEHSDFAEQRCLEIYSSYVSYIDSSIKMFQHPQRMQSLENKATDYIKSWETVSSTGKKISFEGRARFNEWRKRKELLDNALHNTEEKIESNYYKMKYDKND